MQLDTYTLQLTASLMVLGSLIVMGALRYSRQEKEAVSYWLAGFAFAGPGFLLLALRPQLPDYSETVSNTSIIMGMLLLNRGLRVFVGMRQRVKIEAGIILAYIVPFLESPRVPRRLIGPRLPFNRQHLDSCAYLEAKAVSE